MNCAKFREIFNPDAVNERIHIVGCGSVGSTLAEMLARYGLTKFTLYDFDIVEDKNIANQMFRHIDIGKTKVEALKEMLIEINPDVEKDIILEEKGYTGQNLKGYVFLAVDNIELRREICEKNQYLLDIVAVFDIRTGLYDAQHFAADWKNTKDKKGLINSMQFSHEDAMASTPVSACGVTFGVAPTVRMVCVVAVANFVNFVLEGKIKKQILVNPFDFEDENTVVVCG